MSNSATNCDGKIVQVDVFNESLDIIQEVPNKKRKIDESAAIIKMNKKVVLNPNILDDILYHLLTNNNVTQLQKFMLSGKEPFAAVLRYFSKLSVESVSIDSNNTNIRFQKCQNYLTCMHFPYPFPHLNNILAVIPKAVKEMSIIAYPQSVAGKSVLAFFTQKDLKKIRFVASCNSKLELPNDYANFFKNECTFDKIFYDHCTVKSPSVSDVFMMNSTHHEICFNFERFIKIFKKTEEGVTFPAVQKLTLIHWLDNSNELNKFLFSIKSIKIFMSHIAAIFPNLKSLNVDVAYCCKGSRIWLKTFNTIVSLYPQMFDYFPSQIKGRIFFHVLDECTDFDMVVQKIGENVGIHIHDKYDGFEDDEYSCVSKAFNIHDGLLFETAVEFSKRIDRYSSDDDRSGESFDESGEDF